MIWNTITNNNSDHGPDRWLIKVIKVFNFVSKRIETINKSRLTVLCGCVIPLLIFRKIGNHKGCVILRLILRTQSPALDLNQKSADVLPPHGKKGFTFNSELTLVPSTQTVMFNPNRNRKIRPRRSRAMNPQYDNSSSSDEVSAQVHIRPQSHILAEKDIGNTNEVAETT